MKFTLIIIYTLFIIVSNSITAKASNNISTFFLNRDKSDNNKVNSDIDYSNNNDDIIDDSIIDISDEYYKQNDNSCKKIADIVQDIKKSVLRIKTFKIDNKIIKNENSYFDYKESMNLNSIGSAFVISEDGYILTNNHVINDSDIIKVYLEDNTEYNAELIGVDSYKDIALLKINVKFKLKPLKLENNINYNVGDTIIAFGDPYGLGLSVSTGIISALNREIKNIELGNLIQIDAPINKGNSGGPLIDCNGNLIGINTMMYFDLNNKSVASRGIGFAIPINDIFTSIERLKEVGYIQRGWLGITGVEADDNIFRMLNSKRKTGVLVLNIEKNSPADKAGILVGDIIVSYNKIDILSYTQLLSMIRESNVGNNAEITVLRNDKYIKIKVNIGEYSENDLYDSMNGNNKNNSINFMDMVLTKINDGVGMYVSNVVSGGIADYYGLEVGDILLTINQYQLDNLKHFYGILDNLKQNNTGNFFMIIKKKNMIKNIVLKFSFNLINN